jgi:hypothetical protein
MARKLGYDSESNFCGIIESSLRTLKDRVTLPRLKELLKDIGHNPVEWPSFDEEKPLSPSHAASRPESMNVSFERSYSRMITSNKKETVNYEIHQEKGTYLVYRDNYSGKLHTGLKYKLQAADDNPSHDPFILQLTRLNNFKCKGVVEFEGFFPDPNHEDQVILLFENHLGAASDYFSEKRLDGTSISELCSQVSSWLDFLHVNKSFLPTYITPKNIVITSENPLRFKLIALKQGLEAPSSDWYWLSPEHFQRMKGNSGELILDKPLVYSMALTLLDIVTKG